ncbi:MULTISPECIES: D-2-hydroxyacid dehydrogenase [unclassified Arthrobacter]|uniref:D-2-hydroxyacid dehydrogenase n=1 Tax=unclassified Arthrobacter TaxID=235627 RepID=UPI0014926EC1|nr:MULTISPECIES: D-2-hydroxyacid dehydrogenase [unclassified Arthrobacter]MBE0009709.1 D-2-hydroxyacid dehydrogenase [Arthrobacter sp. AET 35A]NOJ63599.1 D-2-hydroxyacid dehydrogenase [Arthrobacter sp. 147(2020)]
MTPSTLPPGSAPTGRRPIVTVLVGDRPVVGLERVAALADIRETDAAGLPEALDGADVLYLWDFFSGALAPAWQHAGSLRWLHVAAAGVDKLLFPELVTSPVTITNAHGVFDRPMAEYVLGAMLFAAKGFGQTRDQQRQKLWGRRTTRNIAGSRVLVVGTGSIGRCTARLLTAAGANVDGAGRSARTNDPDFGRVHASSDLATIVGGYDYLVLVAPLTPQTHGMVSAAVLDAMAPTSVLINVGRGKLVDEAALVRVLDDGGIAGAVLDTFAVEPLPPSSPLWGMGQVLISPHMASDADSWLNDLALQFERNFLAWHAGKALPHQVDKELGYVPTSS